MERNLNGPGALSESFQIHKLNKCHEVARCILYIQIRSATEYGCKKHAGKKKVEKGKKELTRGEWFGILTERLARHRNESDERKKNPGA